MNENNSNENLTNENANNEQVKNEVENKVEYVPKKKKNRKGDKDIYVQYRKPSIFSTILLVLIGILVGIVAMLLIYIFGPGKDLKMYQEQGATNLEENQEEVDTNTELDLSIEGEFVKSLYKKIPMQIRGYEPYSGAFIRMEHIHNNNKLLYTLRVLEEEFKYQLITDITDIKPKLDNKMQLTEDYLTEVKKFDFATVEARYKSIFGSHNGVPLIDAETTLGYVYEYVPQDNCYYGHLYPGGGGGSFSHQTKLYKCEQNKEANEIYLYDCFIGANNAYSGMGNVAIYTSSNCTNLIFGGVKLDYNGRSPLYDGMNVDQFFEKHWDSLAKFKHTYKLDDSGNYFWFSSEPIQ